ncbi:hypothetical protein DFI02_1011303 [Rhizobium sp. PP-F2F-G20b]|nr:hypothetical protein DFI02_1011303 [Rhizobium sp. PP-F2F-G20b]
MSAETRTRTGPQEMPVRPCIEPNCRKWGSLGMIAAAGRQTDSALNTFRVTTPGNAG